MARRYNTPSEVDKDESRSTWSQNPPYYNLVRNILILVIAVMVFWFLFWGWITSWFASSTVSEQSGTRERGAAVNYCRPVPESFRNGSRELRFRNSSPLCYDVVLGNEWTPLIYPPLENKSGDDLINLITPGEVEVRVLNSQSYKWTETEESLTSRSKLAWNFNEKCMIFRLRGSGTVRIQVDRRERMTPGGVEQSTHCPGMY